MTNYNKREIETLEGQIIYSLICMNNVADWLKEEYQTVIDMRRARIEELKKMFI